MLHASTPWAGLAALVAMFVLPHVPDWLFEGPRTVKHWPRRHLCGACGAPWTKGHACASDEAATRRPLRGELRRLGQGAELERRTTARVPMVRRP